MKVMHLLQSGKFSGAENVVCQIISMFRDEADIEMVYCSKDGQIRDALKERDIRFVPMSKLCVSEVKRVIKEYKPDIIHAHDMNASFTAALACGRTTLISHIHNNSFDSRKISVKAIAYLFAALKSKHIFWVSESSFKGYCFHKWFSKKSSILYNILDIDGLYQKMMLDQNEYTYDVVYLGRLTYPKNPQRLMSVLKAATERYSKLSIAIVGSGDLEKETRALCQKYGLESNVHFLGFQSNPLKILRDSKVMVMTSRWEGTPMCALEAMALGVPIVSTPVDGLKDLVVNGENGYLFDDDDRLANALVNISTESSLHDRLSKRQIDMSIEYNSIENYKKEICRAYGSIRRKNN